MEVRGNSIYQNFIEIGSVQLNVLKFHENGLVDDVIVTISVFFHISLLNIPDSGDQGTVLNL